MKISRFAGRLLVLQLFAALWATICLAHPMGNFSINHYAGIHVGKDAVEFRYILDFAEIPTYQEIQQAGIVARADDPSLRPYLARQSTLWARNLVVTLNGEAVHLEEVSSSVIFPPGAGGLPTMKIGVVYRAVFRQRISGLITLHYRDENFAGHAGWKEIVATASRGAILAPGPDGAQPFQSDRSAQLTNYPTSLLDSPPQDLEADISYRIEVPLPSSGTRAAKLETASSPGAGPMAKPVPTPEPFLPSLPTAHGATTQEGPSGIGLAPNKQATPRSRFTELMLAPGNGLWFLVTAAFLAAGLGAMHALEPGHGKTIVAAYLVGSRGSTRHAVGLGLLVTAAHTAGVYMLGAAVLYASKYMIPERIYPWLSIFSGLVIAVLAGYLFLKAWTGFGDSGGEDGLTPHTHWYSRRAPEPMRAVSAGAPASEKTVPLRQLLILGITGGIVPCPAALVVLLSAVSLHRIGLGLFLIVSFSVGLASVLIGIGIMMVRGRHLLSRWKSDAPWVQRWLPLISSSAMLLAGLAIAVTALPSTGISFHFASLGARQLPSFAAIIGLGLILGIRHSTDPDHVVAVSTIVTRERSVKQGALIGMMWGFGHTLTIFMVGAAIILFKLTIPPRLGLAMEMAVAAMLILLGVLNLAGVLQRLTERFTPSAWTVAAPPGGPDLDVRNRAQLTGPGRARALFTRHGYYQMLRPLAIGLVHGLAGSAAVALLVLSMIPSPAWAVAYLIIFGLGTVAGMMLMTTAMSIPIALTGRKSSRYLTVASGLASICFGLFLVYQIGFVDGLFTKHVHWTPS